MVVTHPEQRLLAWQKQWWLQGWLGCNLLLDFDVLRFLFCLLKMALHDVHVRLYQVEKCILLLLLSAEILLDFLLHFVFAAVVRLLAGAVVSLLPFFILVCRFAVEGRQNLYEQHSRGLLTVFHVGRQV